MDFGDASYLLVGNMFDRQQNARHSEMVLNAQNEEFCGSGYIGNNNDKKAVKYVALNSCF